MKTRSQQNKVTTVWESLKRVSLLAALLCYPVYAGVNPDGSYSESIPIEVPAGRNGIQPKLALSYNSNGGNGIVGVGWSIQGLPAITRMNYGNGINYNGGDTYAGPEGRLIDVSASAGLPAGSLYHAENESWSKYEPLGWDGNLLNGGNRCGDAACAWRVTDRSGAISLYGDAGASRVGAIDSSGNAMHGGSVRVWALSRVADLHGNYYEVEYYQNAGQFYPKKITYTLGNWASRFYAVTFDYDQNGRPDKETSFAQLSMVQTNWRLSGISVTYKDSCLILFTCSNIVRSYGLEYDTSGGLIRSRLVRWQEFDASAELRARLSFSWNAANAGFSGAGNFNPPYALWNRPGGDSDGQRLIDVNGDGLPDLLRGLHLDGTGYFAAWINTGSGWAYAPQWNPPVSIWFSANGKKDNEGVEILDINNDGLPDILKYLHDGGTSNYVGAWLNNGNGWSYAPQFNPPYALWNRAGGDSDGQRLVDLNGDGLPDLLRGLHLDGTGYFAAWINTGNGWISAPQWNPPVSIWFSSNGKKDNEGVQILDINNDGRPDIIKYLHDGGTSNYAGAWLNNGNGWTYAPQFNPPYALWHRPAADPDGQRLIDVNGDGLPDLLRGLHSNGTSYFAAWLNTGNGWISAPQWNPPVSLRFHGTYTRPVFPPVVVPIRDDEGVEFVDVNGDGLVDIVKGLHNGSTYLGAWLNNGNGWTYAPEWNPPHALGFRVGEKIDNEGVQVLDVNGDGFADVIRGLHDGGPTYYGAWINNAHHAHLLSRIDSISGAATTIEYTPARQAGNAICVSCAAPGIANSTARYLATKVTSTSDRDLDASGSNDSFVTRYEYTNGRVSTGTIFERASLGFEKIKSIDENSQNYSITTYRQDKPFHTTPSVTRSYMCTAKDVSGNCTGSVLASEQIAATPQQYFCDETGCTLDTANTPNPSLPKQARYSGESIKREYINGIEALVTRQQVVSYDNYGNPLETRITRQLGSEIYTERNFATYVNDLGDYDAFGVPATRARAIGLPINLKKCVEDCSQFNTVEDKENYYDGQPLGQAGLRQLITGIKLKIGSTTLTKNFTYYTNGNLHTETNDSAAVKTYIYDPDYLQYVRDARLTVPGKPDQISTQYVDVRFGLVTENIDTNGAKTKTKLDDQGRIKEVLVIDVDGVLKRRKSYEYYLTGNPDSTEHYTKECAHRKLDPSDSLLEQKDCSYTYVDALNRKYLSVTPGTNDVSAAFTAVHTKYDSLGRVTHVSNPYFKDATSSVGTPANYTETVYDNFGRAWRQIRPDGKVVETNILYSAGSNVVVTQNVAADGTIKESATDARGLIRSTTEAKGTNIESTVIYSYHLNGLLYEANSPQGITSIEYYPETRQQKHIIDSNAGMTQYTYITNITSLAFGKIFTETRPAPNGAGDLTVTHEYNDPYGRLTKQIYSTGEIAEYAYDEADVLNGNAQLTRSKFTHNQQTIERRYAYNSLAVLAQTKTDISSTIGALCAASGDLPCHSEVGHEFDELGRKTKIIYPDMKETAISYFGGTEQVASIRHNSALIAEYSKYKVTGQAGKLTYANGVSNEYTYNSSTQLLENLTTKNTAQDVLQDLDYTFYDTGSIHELTDNITPDASYTYEYDALNRIKKASRGDGKVFNYAFDAKGNLTLKENRTQYFHSNSTKLQYSDLFTGTDTIRTSFQWSAGGNMLLKATPTVTQNFVYSGRNMMIEASYVGGSMNGATTRFFYDETGQRYGKVFQQPGKEEVRTYTIGTGFEIRETWNGATRTGFQYTKYIFGAGSAKLASLTAQPNSTNFVSQNSMYWKNQQKFYSGNTWDSFLAKARAKSFYLFYRVKETLPQHIPPAAIILLVTALGCVLLWLAYIAQARLSSQPYLAATALATCFVFFNVNCATNSDPAFSNGAYAAIGNTDPLYLGLPSGIHFYSSNHLGSGTLITDASGAEVIRIHYLPYGEIDQNLSGKYDLQTQTLNQSAADAEHGYLGYRFTGQTYDPEEGLAYYNARYLDVTTGVFTTADTELDEGAGNFGFNRFMYVRGNPVMYTDPTGHWIWLVVAAVVLIGGGFVLGGTKGNPFKKENWDNFDWKAAWKGAAAGALIWGTAVAGMPWISGKAAEWLGINWVAQSIGVSLAGAGACVLSGQQECQVSISFPLGNSGGNSSGSQDGGGAAETDSGGRQGGDNSNGKNWSNGDAKSGCRGFCVSIPYKGYRDGYADIAGPEALGTIRNIYDLPNGNSLPLNTNSTAPFAENRGSSNHQGLDLRARKIGVPIPSVSKGTAYSDYNNHWGIHVWVDHGNGYKSLYGHLSLTQIPNVEAGRYNVSEGEVIGLSGDTGFYQGQRVIPHLHFAIWSVKLGRFIDPIKHKWR